MNTVRITMAAALLFSSPLLAGPLDTIGLSVGEWSTEQKYAEIGYQAVHLVDCGQTLQTAANPDRYQEDDSAWLIGKQPSKTNVALWCVGTAYLHAAVTNVLITSGANEWIVRGWQYVTIGVTVSTIEKNYQIGLRIGSTKKTTQPINGDRT